MECPHCCCVVDCAILLSLLLHCRLCNTLIIVVALSTVQYSYCWCVFDCAILLALLLLCRLCNTFIIVALSTVLYSYHCCCVVDCEILLALLLRCRLCNTLSIVVALSTAILLPLFIALSLQYPYCLIMLSQNLMEQYFARIRRLSESNELNLRIRFMLQDVLDLRQAGWRPRKMAIIDGPRTITEVRGDAGKIARK